MKRCVRLTFVCAPSANGRSSSLTESALGVLDDYELAARGGEAARQEFVAAHAGALCGALISAAHALHGRSDMLRITVTLHGVLWRAPRAVVREAIIGIAARSEAAAAAPNSPVFAEPILKIAVERVSDAELSSFAADSLATLFGATALDDERCIDEHCRESANAQAMALVNSLITEVALSASPHALGALGALLRRDFTRTAFCRRDGISTLASTLLTDPGTAHPSIGEAVVAADSDDGADAAKMNVSCDAVAATYHAAFAVWMLSFAASAECVAEVLRCSLSSRLVLVLARLLDHVSGRRLKIARVVLATLRNLSRGDTDLHVRIRREMIGACLPTVLQRLNGMRTTIGRDVDAAADLAYLADSLAEERSAMSTVDNYLAELRAGALRWSSIHGDEAYWAANAERMVTETREVLPLLSAIICGSDAGCDSRMPAESQTVACSDLYHIIRLSVNGRRAALASPNLKARLMMLMASAEDAELRRQALTCVQLLLQTPKR